MQRRGKEMIWFVECLPRLFPSKDKENKAFLDRKQNKKEWLHYRRLDNKITVKTHM